MSASESRSDKPAVSQLTPCGPSFAPSQAVLPQALRFEAVRALLRLQQVCAGIDEVLHRARRGQALHVPRVRQGRQGQVLLRRPRWWQEVQHRGLLQVRRRRLGAVHKPRRRKEVQGARVREVCPVFYELLRQARGGQEVCPLGPLREEVRQGGQGEDGLLRQPRGGYQVRVSESRSDERRMRVCFVSCHRCLARSDANSRGATEWPSGSSSSAGRTGSRCLRLATSACRPRIKGG